MRKLKKTVLWTIVNHSVRTFLIQFLNVFVSNDVEINVIMSFTSLWLLCVHLLTMMSFFQLFYIIRSICCGYGLKEKHLSNLILLFMNTYFLSIITSTLSLLCSFYKDSSTRATFIILIFSCYIKMNEVKESNIIGMDNKNRINIDMPLFLSFTSYLNAI